MISLTSKQKIFWREANSRWNIKIGATGSGKTYLDYFRIPKRIRTTKGQGLIVILGNTKGTIERNILDPMRSIYGPKMVGSISSNNTVRLFGKKVYTLGADKKNSVEVIQGSTIEYCYGDEIPTWSEEVFQMVKSRLRTDNSAFDGTGNPDNPSHWFKTFLDSGADIYYQHYTIDDNPHLPPGFVEQLKKEYEGTIYYNRYILGQWVRAEGTIYRKFADDPNAYLKPLAEDIQLLNIGVDFGGNKSKHAFVASAILTGFRAVQTVAAWKLDTNLDPDELNQELIRFIQYVTRLTGRLPDAIYPDSAEQVLIRGMRASLLRNGINITVQDARKIAINDRIALVTSLIGLGRYSYTEHATSVRKALMEAVWDERKQASVRLDDGSIDIDTLDAMEYSIERFRGDLLYPRKQDDRSKYDAIKALGL